MFKFPDTDRKLRNRISSYMSSMMKEKRQFGSVRDGAGKRYLMFWFNFVLNDTRTAEEYMEWYQKEFPDDSGEPIQKLCWALTLLRLNRENDAMKMLGKTMLSNLYLIPTLIGRSIQEYEIWHPSNYDCADYVDYIPTEVVDSITEAEIQWMSQIYDSNEFRGIRQRYIEIWGMLKNTREYDKRTRLLEESKRLLDGV